MVTCGTGIGADELEVLLSLGGIGSSWEQANRRIIDFPGWETVDQVAMLRGRFRPIVSTIEEIIAKGSTSYWKETVEQRVHSLVCYPERFPVRGNLCSDIKRMLDKVAKDPAKSKDTVDIRHVLRQTVVFRASLGLPWSLQGEEPILVESAFVRLRISADQAATEKTVKTIIDEPFVFQAAYNLIQKEDERFYNYFREQYILGLVSPIVRHRFVMDSYYPTCALPQSI
ncbi:hypothetical protein EC957_009873 [Mortierella hygrophila]|uniref:Uncharacterized protein n=1 Tax=Mortierella hygrophila TaxID=979708 RepID=A0A9P6EWQ9_9FUNG|nr:hypothetical protein EC957_009873 [Mortierella hygrophila]